MANAKQSFAVCNYESFLPGEYFQPEEKTAMNRQFQSLMALVNDVDPAVYEHLQRHDANDVVFAYRYIYIHR